MAHIDESGWESIADHKCILCGHEMLQVCKRERVFFECACLHCGSSNVAYSRKDAVEALAVRTRASA